MSDKLIKFSPKRVRSDVEIVHWDMTAMVKHAHQAPSVQISSVLITVSVMKTPSVFNIQTAHRCASAKPALLEMVSEKTVAPQVTWMLASHFDVATVDHASETEQLLIAYVHLERVHLCATER